MSNARLISVEVENFKSYREATRLDLKPLTVMVGRNNSGKSSIVQALLLLKQTLENPRAEVPLHMQGVVEAIHLRELTHGWPESIDGKPRGPRFRILFDSWIDTHRSHGAVKGTSTSELVRNGLRLTDDGAPIAGARVITTIDIQFIQNERRVLLGDVRVSSAGPLYNGTFAANFPHMHPTVSVINKRIHDSIDITWDHFIPLLSLDRRSVGPRARSRVDHNLWLFLCEQPLEDLRSLLKSYGFLGSSRATPPTLYRVSAAEPPESVGASGEYAAELLHARRNDLVHYLPPLRLENEIPAIPAAVRAKPLVAALNDVFREMGIEDEVSIEDVADIGFRLLFGKATLQHVGRGFTYLLPLVEYGLLLDPMRFDGASGEQPLAEFQRSLTRYSHAAFEEPEAHIHPKLQAKLAHWFVSLAMSGRNIVVETHSDHLVRRLRGLMARAPSGSPLEEWLRENVNIVEVTKDHEGVSRLTQTSLDTRGGFEHWPADFMDSATDEEREIYDASLNKDERPPPPPAGDIVHDEGDEPEEP